MAEISSGANMTEASCPPAGNQEGNPDKWGSIDDCRLLIFDC
jgi:hypothetical protein